MRILMLHTQGFGVGYYRHWLPAEALTRKGIAVQYWPGCNSFDHGLILSKVKNWVEWLFANVGDFDAIHSGYSTSLTHIELLVALREAAQIPIILDIDDDPLNVPGYNRAFDAYHPGAPERKVTLLGLRVSDGVTTSTPPLTEILRENTREITTLPNCHDPSVWDGLEVDPQRSHSEDIRLVFAGGHGRYGDLEQVQKPIEHIMKKYPHVRLFFLSMCPDWAAKWMTSKLHPRKNRAFLLQPAMLSTYRKMLRWIGPDIYFSPIQRNEFNKSKSHIKAYDAAEMGAALVCTDWPTHDQIPTDACIKVDDSYIQWVEALEYLIENQPARERLNRKLRVWAREDMHIDRHIEKWVNFYRKVLGKDIVRSAEDIPNPSRALVPVEK